MTNPQNKVVIVGAGIGGLAAAVRLSYAGFDVTVLEAMGQPGGKMRTIPSDAGPVDAGPTVLTMRPVFERLFSDVGQRLEDHVSLSPLSILARHFWDDGTQFDLMADTEESRENVAMVFGSRSANEFHTFTQKADRLFDAFDAPMMQSERPSLLGLIAQTMASPNLAMEMSPLKTLARSLDTDFSEPKLAQLYGRYATYVGGSPKKAPAILSLISSAEARGVWRVEGGMNKLAQALAKLAERFGAEFLYNSPVRQIVTRSGKVTHVETDAEIIPTETILFNGDPRALHEGFLGDEVQSAVGASQVSPRSLSAYVGSFAAVPSGCELAHHNVFFGNEPNAEFDAIERAQMPRDATLYLCAQDNADASPESLQRFEVIMNAPPVPGDEEKEKTQCQTLIFRRFRDFGLHFTPEPRPQDMATPATFNRIFPASLGSLYGLSPHGMMAAFKRPKARTKIKGLYLCGGGTHPGAGVPMATLSAQHAAATIMSDRTSTLMSR